MIGLVVACLVVTVLAQARAIRRLRRKVDAVATASVLTGFVVDTLVEDRLC